MCPSLSSWGAREDYDGDYYNIKLTTPEDLQLAESVLT